MAGGPATGQGRSAALARPAHALRGVFQHDAFGGQLVADGIGTGEVAGLLGGGTLVDQALDAGIVAAVAGRSAEPLCRVGLQQAQRQARTKKLALQACLFGRVGGPACIGGDANNARPDVPFPFPRYASPEAFAQKYRAVRGAMAT